MMAGIPSAKDARSRSTKNVTVLLEIHAIELAIMTAISDGLLTAEVDDGTAMTNTDDYADSTDTISEEYYDTWQGLITDAGKTREMQEVIDYFQTLGYNIARRQNSTTLSTFKWVVSW